jgi:glycosyltransferase involved in cell wall biosynthesis
MIIKEKKRNRPAFFWRLCKGLLWYLRRFFFLNHEKVRIALKPVRRHHHFFIVSCSYNADTDAIKCLKSVYNQKYPKNLITHIFIDDASSDNSVPEINAWLKRHPDNSVNYIRNNERKGGTFNTIWGFRKAPAGSIVIELNGDDWLPDDKTLYFLNKVYADKNIWITYNTLKYSNGIIPKSVKTIPNRIIRKNSYRQCLRWFSSAMHSFRSELFTHIQEGSLIDPATGKYWETADDRAIYISMLELAGVHSRHLYRITYVYNFRDISDENIDKAGGKERVRRIRMLQKYEPLNKLFYMN